MQRETLEVLYICCLSRLYDDFSDHSDYLIEHSRSDLRYLRSRIKNEGVPHVACGILPALGRAVDLALVTGDAFQCPSTLERYGDTKLPRLLYWAMSHFFFDDGSLKGTDVIDPWYIWAVRQITLYAKKWDFGTCVAKNELAAFRDRISKDPDISLSGQEVARIRSRLGAFFERNSCSIQQWIDTPFGRHGPGSVYEDVGPREKWDCLKASIQHGSLRSGLGYNQSVRVDRKINSSVALLVPKDERGQRVICIEEASNQFLQQGLMRVLYQQMAADPFVRRDINLVNQEVSRRACRRLDTATIDLKDASDMVSLKLGKLLLPDWVFRIVCALRSPQVLVDGEFIPSKTLATMGNALCFPLETLIFWGILRSFINQDEKVRVYGDDIIVPKHQYKRSVDLLERAGLVVNTTKSCSKTPLRESCGAVWWNGTDVSAVSPRLSVEDCRTDAVRLSAIANELNSRELHFTACTVYETLWSLYPQVDETRWNCDLQRIEYGAPTVDTNRGKNLTSDYALYAYFTGQQTCPPSKRNLRVKNGWNSQPVIRK